MRRHHRHPPFCPAAPGALIGLVAGSGVPFFFDTIILAAVVTSAASIGK
jgi:hypothetical protein